MTDVPIVTMNSLFWKATLAFLALPGMVAFAIPLLLIAPPWQEVSANVLGFIPLLTGIALLLWCVREFYVAGRGTLAPWSPPQHLVVTGLYRFSRNPMYVAVVLVLLGWALAFRSWALAVYALAVGAGFHLRVILGEEPWLARTFGEEWLRYRSEVPRWLGFRRPTQETCRASG
jgi:protein-S-isoprenylcysteine O-methyltransferase Ste14